MMLQIILCGLFVLGALFFLVVSSVGIFRLPDFYCRNHAVGQSETLGSMLLLAGLAIYNGFDVNSAKILLILLFVAIANPTATHIVARAAYRSGLQPWSLVTRQPVKKDGGQGDRGEAVHTSAAEDKTA